MGRLNPVVSGVLIVVVTAVIEFVGHKADIIYAGSSPGGSLAITLVAIYLFSTWAKANSTTLLTVASASIIYGIAAYVLHLDFYYHDMPEFFPGFITILLIRTAIYLIPVAAGYYTAMLISKKRFNKNNSN